MEITDKTFGSVAKELIPKDAIRLSFGSQHITWNCLYGATQTGSVGNRIAITAWRNVCISHKHGATNGMMPPTAILKIVFFVNQAFKKSTWCRYAMNISSIFRTFVTKKM